MLVILFTIILTILAYLGARYLFMRYKSPWLNVVVISTAIIIITLLVLDIPYQAYSQGADIMTYLLGPATVALAVPLYKNRLLLKKYGWAIFVGIGAGSLVSVLTAVFITIYGGLTREVIISIASKSVTIPFAVEISRLSGGNAALAAAFVVATGTFGSVFGRGLLTMMRITDPVARGLALGTVSHGQGTAMALLEGEQQGAMAGMAMALAGMLTSACAPYFLNLWIK
ncbi:MAG: yohK [Firmicutes bacterium]|nr:yohK [Bacillota bacterium]